MEQHEQIKAVEAWQSNGTMHPLTCGINSEHILVPRVKNGEVTLGCPKCDYTQDLIPEAVYESYNTKNN